MKFTLEREIGAHKLIIETGAVARQAGGAVVVTYGQSIVLGTVCTAAPRPGIDFFPLSVDYRERMSAAGKFPGGFFKREGRPSNKEILTCRMIDRPLRPLFPDGFMDEVQIQVVVLSSDLENDPDVLGMVAAPAAVAISGLPFNGPCAAVRIARIDGEFVINPTRSQLEYSDLELILAGSPTEVNMIEVGCRELSEDAVFAAIEFGHKYGIIPICEMIDELKRRVGKPCAWTPPEKDTSFLSEVRSRVWDEMLAAKSIKGKQERSTAVKAVYEKSLAHYCPAEVEKPERAPEQVKSAVKEVEQEVVRTRILKDGVRSDSRGLDEIREITCEVGWLPRPHGTALFTRGETQALVTTTLGTVADEQLIDEMMEEYSKKFMLHYNFPPFSVGEVRRIMGPGRREIGHGALAERSLEAVLPSPENFPYTVRLVSDILESNGSSSMASVCGGSLSLMDAGVPIKAAVAGISVGLVQEGNEHRLMIDILGEEDGFGDMDFKVAGTRTGITGIQLDIKITGLRFDLLRDALELARQGRMKILDIMDRTIATPRPELSPHAPRLLTLRINPEKIGKLIGPGGKSIRAIQADTGATIDIDDDGTVQISCLSQEGAERARDIVQRMTEDIEVGRIYTGRVAAIKDFGAIVELTDGQDGLCHISELDDNYVRTVTDVVNLGDEVPVKVLAIDDQGRVKLSRKAALRELNKH